MQAGDLGGAVAEIGKAEGALATTGAVFGALTAAEQASTIGVRLTFVENPDRAARSVGIPTAPPVGSGVARSTGNEEANSSEPVGPNLSR